MKPDKIYIQDGAIFRTEKTYDNDVCYIRLDILPEQPVTDCHDLEKEADDLEETIRNKADEMFFASGFYEDVHHDFRIDMSKEEFVAYARHFYELGCTRTAVMYDDIEYERQRIEEAGNEEFEKELHQYWLEQKQKGEIVDGSIDDYITVQEVARHFAEWGAKHAKK